MRFWCPKFAAFHRRGVQVFFAIKNAIASVGNYTLIPIIDAPATPEKILISINKLKKKYE